VLWRYGFVHAAMASVQACARMTVCVSRFDARAGSRSSWPVNISAFAASLTAC
jgi:hypothetical protein